MNATSHKSSHAKGAANLKRELTKAFPGIKFSVSSSSFSMGDDISVHWSLGPTVKEVEAYADRYQEGDFDGMQDLYEYRRDPKGEQFRNANGGAKYVQCSRGGDTQELRKLIEDQLCRLNGIDPGNAAEFYRRFGEDSNTVFWRIFSKTSFPHGAQITGVERNPGVTGGMIEDFYRLVYTAPIARPAASSRNSTVCRVTVTENHEKSGIELRFPQKPEDSVLESLKGNGWRWSRFNACWYAPNTTDNAAYAKALEQAQYETPEPDANVIPFEAANI